MFGNKNNTLYGRGLGENNNVMTLLLIRGNQITGHHREGHTPACREVSVGCCDSSSVSPDVCMWTK